MSKYTTDQKNENIKVSEDIPPYIVKADASISGDMFLTTSIVTEQIRDTNLEHISPY